MRELSELISASIMATAPETPAVMVAQVIDTDPLRVLVPSIDGGKHAFNAFGTVTALEGDEVRVVIDEAGGVVVIAA